MTSENESEGGGLGLQEIQNGRWGYIVVFCKFMLMFLGSGVGKSFGVLIPEMVDRLGGSYAGVGFACSLPGTIMMLSGPIITFILVRFNRRLVAMLGGLISAVCLGACAFAPDITVLGLWLALSGLGRACAYHASTLLLNEYFPDKFVLVNTLSLYGNVFGVMILPVVTERSLEAYGYSWAFLILGALTLHIVACAAALRSPVFKKVARTKGKGKAIKESARGKKGHGSGASVTEVTEKKPKGRTIDNTSVNKMTVVKRKANKTEAVVGNKRAKEFTDISESTLKGSHGCNSQHEYPAAFKENNSSLTETKKSDEVNEFSSDSEEHYPLIPESSETDNIIEHSDVSDTNQAADETGAYRSIKSIFEIYCKPILKEHVFLVSLPVVLLHNYIINAWILFLVPHAEQVGIIQSKAVFLATIGGIGGILGRTLAVVFLAKKIDMIPVYIVAGATCSTTFLLDAFGDDFVSLAALAFVQGLCLFVLDTTTLGFLKITVVKEDNFSTAYGINCAIFALGFIFAGFVTGALFDAIHSYTKIFVIIGGIEVLFVANVILIKVLINRRQLSDH